MKAYKVFLIGGGNGQCLRIPYSIAADAEVTEGNEALNRTLQLSDIAGPIVTVNCLHDMTGEVNFIAGAVLVEEVESQQRNIFFSLPEGGD